MQAGWPEGWVLASQVLRVVMGWVGTGVPPGLVGSPHPSHSTKILEMWAPKWPCGEEWSGQEILYCRVGEGESRERSRRGRGLNTPQWGSAWSDWLGAYGSSWLEVGAEGGFKLEMWQDCDSGRQDRDPGKQKLKGAVRTETYWRHYCQQNTLVSQKSEIIEFWNSICKIFWHNGSLLNSFSKLQTYWWENLRFLEDFNLLENRSAGCSGTCL
jgi:hypothetical protein